MNFRQHRNQPRSRSKLEASKSKLEQTQSTPNQFFDKLAKSTQNQRSDQEGNGGSCDERIYRVAMESQGYSTECNSKTQKSETSSEETEPAKGVQTAKKRQLQ